MIRAKELKNNILVVDRKGRRYKIVSFKLDRDGYLIESVMERINDKQIELINKTLFEELNFSMVNENMMSP